MSRKRFQIIAAGVLCGSMLMGNLAGAQETLDAGQADEYTQANMANAANAQGGTVFPQGTFDSNTDYTDETFENDADPEDTVFPEVYPKDKMEALTGEALEEVIDAVMASITYEEKINMVSMNSDPENRSGVGYMTGIPRLGIPESRMHDGPAGISTSGDSYVETTNPPMQLIASMSWSEDAITKYGQILGSEHKSTGSGWQLGTQMDLVRTPHWARAKDTFGEDYFLTSRMTVAETKAVQSTGGLAMAKHIGAYATDGDTSLWLDVDEQTLHTAYLYPFETAVKEADVSSIMGTYNRLNGYYVSSNKDLQTGILRDQWNYQGAMVPDWGADKEFSMALGTTISQSNADRIDKQFRSAVSQGILSMEDLDQQVRYVLHAYGVCGFLNLVEIDSNGFAKEEPGRTAPIRYERTYTEDREAGLYDENNEKAREIAEKAITLLKNEDQTLPLTEEDYTGDNSVALIGYGAVNLVGGTGGERSFGVLQYMTTPYESMMAIAGEDANISAYILDNVHGTDIPAELVFQTEDGSENGWVRTNGIKAEDVVETRSMFGPPPMGGAPQEEEKKEPQPVENPGTELGSLYGIEDEIHLTTGTRSFQNAENGTALTEDEAYTWTGYLEAPVTGDYKLIIQTNGGSASVTATGDEKEEEETPAAGGMPAFGAPTEGTGSVNVSDGVSWDFYTTEGLNYSILKIAMTEGQRYKVVVTAQHTSPYRDQGVRLSWILPGQDEADLAAAVEAAARNDTVVMFTRTGATGHGPVFQTDFDISLDELDEIRAVQKAAKENGNKFVLVVLGRSGFSFEGDWLDDTDALLLPLYAGQSAGTAIAEILTGVVNPSGKLTITLPKTNADTLLTYGYYDNDETLTNYNTYRAGDQSQQEYTAHYEEGLNFGYRWYDAEEIEPQYAFGYGLSYTTFDYSDISAAANEDHTATITLTVTNTGSVTGSEIVEAYVGPAENVPENVQQAAKQLCAFERVEDLAPGESREVVMNVPERMLSYWDSSRELIEREDGTSDKWVLAEGSREIMVGNSSDNITWTGEISVF